ncbi:DoxX family protein [Sorangium sp. So ce1335]|uniref:DoxX family protein n=1 Tax=Sorangium sp. So ce1335 TaxID=3133335 RepID=UPI003F607E42
MSNRTSFTEARYSQWAPLLMRLVMGHGFIVHGWVKLSRGPARFEMLLAQIGVPSSKLAAWVVPLVELLGGIAVLAGAFMAITAVPLVATMLAAMFSVHLEHGFSSVNTIGLTADGPVFGPPGYEINLLYIAGLLSLALGGAGAFSFDALMVRRRRQRGQA